MQINYLFWFFSFCFINLITGQAVNKHFPNRDEFETIDKSRKIIKRIEQCQPDSRDSGSSDSNSEMPVINSEEEVVCGETTFMHITRLNENKIQDLDVMRNAMSVTYKAIQQMNAFIDIASFIEKSIKQPKTGQWLTVVGKTANFDSSLKTRVPEYLDFTISHIKVQIFNIETNCASSGRYATPPPDTSNPVSIAPESYHGARINPNAIAVIKKNSMPGDQRKDTLKFIKNALKEYSNTDEGVNYVCPAVTNELTVNYGTTKWACVAGEKNYYQFTSTLDRGAQLQAQFDNLLIEIHELPQSEAARNCPPTPAVPTSPKVALPTQYEIITSARSVLDPNYVEVNETRLDYQSRNRAIQAILDSVAVQSTFDSITKDLQIRLEKMFGQFWATVVGTDTQLWTYFYVQNPYFINVKIDKLRVIAYKQMR